MEVKRNDVEMEAIKAKAIEVVEGMETYFPQFAISEELKISELQLEPLTYAYNNSVIAFVTEEKKFFVLPCFKGTEKTLLANGYRKAYFYVPFSNWDFPLRQRGKWERLWKQKNFE